MSHASYDTHQGTEGTDTHGQSLRPEIQSGHDAHASTNSESTATSPLTVTTYTKALIAAWKDTSRKIPVSLNRISISQNVSFLAFFYEKIRNVVEFREEHLIRRASIERILKRRMILNENGREIAELLLKELLWARYYENNSIGQEKIGEVQTVIDKYFFIRNEVSSGRSIGEKDKIASFIVQIIACEIEEVLSPDPRKEAFTNFAYQLIRPHIPAASFNNSALERDIQVYIAVERTFARSDDPVIRYQLLKLMIPEITTITWKTADKILSRFYEVYRDIEKSLQHPLKDKLRTVVKKQAPPFFILQDVFRQNSPDIESILSDETKLKQKVDLACRRRYEETKTRLRRTGIRSFIYIILTKVIFAFILEVPYDLYVIKSISYLPIITNVIVPPLLMSLIILTVTVPGDDNTRRIFNLIKSIVTQDPEKLKTIKSFISLDKPLANRGPVFSSLFSALYLAAYVVSFGSIIYLLSEFNFNPVSQGIFIVFITLVTFFAFRVINITKEYLVVDKEGPLTPIFDFFFLPIIRVGQWLSGEVLSRFNVFIFFFDFIIEMPLKAIIEVIDEWAKFIRLKKEEIV